MLDTLDSVSGSSSIESNIPPASPLLWPDSENLLQNIMSLDNMSWGQPIGRPPVLAMTPYDSASTARPSSSLESGDRAGDSHLAIRTVSNIITNTMSSVTAHAALSDLTSKFLDSCLHMYFTHIFPLFPILHRPTFVFRDCLPPLLLNAIALGSLFLGTPDAIAKGEALWKLARTSVATSWHTMISQQGEYDSSSGVQLVITALLSQIYAVLSRNRTLRMTSQVFNGLGINGARFCGMFNESKIPELPRPYATVEEKTYMWRTWLARETQIRALLGTFIIDGIISQFSGSPTMARHTWNPLPIPAAEAVFNAESVDLWVEKMRSQPTVSLRFCDIFHILFSPDMGKTLKFDLSLFCVKVILEGVHSLVADIRRFERFQMNPIGAPSEPEISIALVKLREYIVSNECLSDTERSIALLRWHAIALDMVANTARGIRRLCHQNGITQNIFGGTGREEFDPDPLAWLQTEAAHAALLHASQIQTIVSQLPFGSAYDIHVPGAIFAAATIFSTYALAGYSKVAMPLVVDWRVVLLSHSAPSSPTNTETMWTTSQFLASTYTSQENGTIIRYLSYELSSMRMLLRSLSLQWGVTQEMDEVLDAWISRCV